MESFLSALLFIISVASIFVPLVGVRKPAVNNDQMVTGTLVAQNVLEDLRSKVDSATAPELDSSGNPHTKIYTLPSGSYDVSYNVIQDPTGARQVNLIANWQDMVK